MDRCLCGARREPGVIDKMRDEKHSVSSRAVVFQILGVPLAHVEETVESPQKEAMRHLFDASLQERLRHAELGIAADKYRRSGATARARRLQE